MPERKQKIFSFFAGSGFLDLGFEKNGFEIEAVNEYQHAFMDAYKYSRTTMKLREPSYGYYEVDINEFLTVRRKQLSKYLSEARRDGSLVGFIGGPPCPDFSIAGKNKGRDGDNGKLTKSYIDLIIMMRPDFFLFENVKGLWRTARHRAFFDELKEMLRTAGYVTTERLTNALEYGAPQDRDRILMFGIQKAFESFYPISNYNWEAHQRYHVDEIKHCPWPTTDPFIPDVATKCPSSIPKELTVEYWFERNDVINHPNANDYFIPRNGLRRMETIEEGDVSRKSYKRLHRWRYSPTVAYGNNEVHLHPYKVRRLSAAEALALQTLPKEFSLPANMTLSNKFKTIGNGVPYLLSSGIAMTIHEYLQSLSEHM